MECFGCKYHETFSDDMDEGSYNDGCVCYNEQAEKEDRHLICCFEYGGKEECPHREYDE